jgi:PAS domain S-box-containing protein
MVGSRLLRSRAFSRGARLLLTRSTPPPFAFDQTGPGGRFYPCRSLPIVRRLAVRPFRSIVSHRLVLALGVVSAGAILASATLAIAHLRTEAVEHAERRLADLATVLGEQTARAVDHIDGLLNAIAQDALRRAAGGELSTGRALHDDLLGRFGHVPQLRALVVLNRTGDMIAVTERFPPPPINNADREHFAVHRDGTAQGLFLGPPIMGRATGARTVPLSRAVRRPTGEFLGVVGAAVNPPYFEALYGSLDLGPAGTIRMYRQDGAVLAAYPASASVDASAELAAIASRGAAAGGVVHHPGADGAAERIVAFRRLQAYPLLVAISAAKADVLGPWRRYAWTFGALGAGAAAFVVGLAALLARQLRAERALRDEIAGTEARWRFALEGADHDVFDWDVGSGHFYRSPRYLELLGYAAGEVPEPRPKDEWVHPEDRERIRALREAIAAGRVAQFSEGIRVLRRDGSALPVLMRGMVVERGPDGRGLRIIGTLTDVSAIEAARGRALDSEARLNGIVQSAMDGIITVDQDQRIVLFNGAAERLFGCPADEAIGGSLDRFIPERLRAAHRANVERFAASGETARRMGDGMDLVALRADGTEFPVDGSISRVTVAGRTLLTVILRDTSERRRAAEEIARSHAELRGLAAGMHEVREAERTRIARELHDELGQALTALKMDLEALEARIPRGQADLFERTAAMRGLLDFTFATTRRLSADLRPLVLDDLGLAAAADWLVHGLIKRAKLDCDVHIDPSLADLGEPQATVLFRVLQESLTNVARHSNATRVEIRLERDGEHAVLTVRDDGTGMEAGAQAKPRSFGLRGIRERVLVLGGEVELTSRPGEGTTLRARVPLPAALQATEAA